MSDWDIMSSLIGEFLAARDPVEIERLADDLGDTGDPRAIEPLVRRVSDWMVQADGDAEDAICGALVKLGVMHKLGNLNFRWLPAEDLSADTRLILTSQLQALPAKYAVREPGGFPGT